MQNAPVIFWFRRDLRLADNPALLAALKAAGDAGVVPLFIGDPDIVAGVGPTRASYLEETLHALSVELGGNLVYRTGRPEDVLGNVVRESGASAVYLTKDYAPLGMSRDAHIRESLGTVSFHEIDSPYIVPPGSIFSKTGEPFKVFTAFRRVWDTFEIPKPLPAPQQPVWRLLASEPLSTITEMAGSRWPAYFGDLALIPAAPRVTAGERVALDLLAEFVLHVDDYAEQRNMPGTKGTSRLSPHLRFGSIHPRQVADAVIGDSDGRRIFLSEIAWREFYADVLFHNPSSTTQVLQSSMNFLPVDTDAAAQERFRRWAVGETGYPLVDAGMRQLLETGWMHNRVRMVAASFLVKHLHLDWRWGAAWFMWRLVDGDVASNQHGWQWTAGTGTDAAPYHRIFNPTLQAERFDPNGDYVKRWIPALSTVSAPQCLQPGGGEGLLTPAGYVTPMIDAKTERDEALRRFALARELAANARG